MFNNNTCYTDIPSLAIPIFLCYKGIIMFLYSSLPWVVLGLILIKTLKYWELWCFL